WFQARERLLNEGEGAARLVAARERVTPGEFLKSLDLLELPSLEKNREMLGAGGGRSYAKLQELYKSMARHQLVRGVLPGREVFEGGFLP
ncbi:MAG TPA: hypothetical protein VK633_06750, partial [Verrucomicrobiae bacterium]|nr:hypothetical protein [Verrucomicrobiae bacterium]